MEKSFSIQLKEYKEKHSLTKGQMATLLGMSERMYVYYENGDYDGSKSRVNKYLQKLSENPTDRVEEPVVTYGQLIDAHEETIKALKGENKAQSKYIAVLEDKLGIK